MNIAAKYHFSGRVANFQEKRLPEKATLAGYAALIEAYDLKVPLPRTLSATGEKHRVLERDGWRILTPRHAPKASFGGHLYFALKHEGLDLVILKRLFGATGPAPIETIVQTTPTGSYARRIWFLYEWLTKEKLDLPDATLSECPTSSKLLRHASSVSTSAECSPMVGSFKRNRVRDCEPDARNEASFRRCDSPPESVVAGCPSGR